MNDLVSFIELWKTSVIKQNQQIYTDAKKEFNQTSKTAYGADGNAAQTDLDFEMVRGDFENNAFIKEITNQLNVKTASADALIHKLSKIK